MTDQLNDISQRFNCDYAPQYDSGKDQLRITGQDSVYEEFDVVPNDPDQELYDLVIRNRQTGKRLRERR